jgi:hypothetical protein
MAYNRTSAVGYATSFFSSVCHDGCVATNDGTRSKLVKATAGGPIPSISNEDDCAHFVSCCIGHNGGGLALGVWDLPPAYGVLSPDSLLARLTSKGLATVVGRGLNAADAGPAMTGLAPGDVILYGATAGGLFHSALHMGGGLIACHTNSRLNRPFTSVVFDTVTLLHIV